MSLFFFEWGCVRRQKRKTKTAEHFGSLDANKDNARDRHTQTIRIANEVSGRKVRKEDTHTHTRNAFAVLAAPSLSPEEV